jgi:hypothetical protein
VPLIGVQRVIRNDQRAVYGVWFCVFDRWVREFEALRYGIRLYFA